MQPSGAGAAARALPGGSSGASTAALISGGLSGAYYGAGLGAAATESALGAVAGAALGAGLGAVAGLATAPLIGAITGLFSGHPTGPEHIKRMLGSKNPYVQAAGELLAVAYRHGRATASYWGQVLNELAQKLVSLGYYPTQQAASAALHALIYQGQDIPAEPPYHGLMSGQKGTPLTSGYLSSTRQPAAQPIPAGQAISRPPEQPITPTPQPAGLPEQPPLLPMQPEGLPQQPLNPQPAGLPEQPALIPLSEQECAPCALAKALAQQEQQVRQELSQAEAQCASCQPPAQPQQPAPQPGCPPCPCQAGQATMPQGTVQQPEQAPALEQSSEQIGPVIQCVRCDDEIERQKFLLGEPAKCEPIGV